MKGGRGDGNGGRWEGERWEGKVRAWVDGGYVGADVYDCAVNNVICLPGTTQEGFAYCGIDSSIPKGRL